MKIPIDRPYAPLSFYRFRFSGIVNVEFLRFFPPRWPSRAFWHVYFHFYGFVNSRIFLIVALFPNFDAQVLEISLNSMELKFFIYIFFSFSITQLADRHTTYAQTEPLQNNLDSKKTVLVLESSKLTADQMTTDTAQ